MSRRKSSRSRKKKSQRRKSNRRQRNQHKKPNVMKNGYITTSDILLQTGFKIVSTDLEWMCPSSTTPCKDRPIRPNRMGDSIWFSELKKSKESEVVSVHPIMFGKPGQNPIAFKAVWMKNLRTKRIKCYGLNFLARFDATDLPPSEDPRKRIGKMTRLPLYPSGDDRNCVMPSIPQQDSVDVLLSDILRFRAEDGEYRFFSGTKYEFWNTGRLIAFAKSDRSTTFYAVVSQSPDMC